MENNLAKSAYLVSVSIVNGGLLGERRDNAASELVENTFDVAHRRAKASKYLIDRKHKQVKAVIAASQRVRETVYKYTNPWGDDKSRLLVVDLKEIFDRKLDRDVQLLHEAWDDYVKVYPQLVADSERDLGQLFERSQYPHVDQIRDKFSVKAYTWPLPQSHHFIAKIADNAALAAKEAIEQQIEERLLEASADMVRRATDVVTTFVDRLEGFKKKDETSGAKSFRDSLVENIQETACLIEAMNITSNPQIVKVVKQLQRLGKFSAWQLRNGERYRIDAISEGQQILTNLAMLDLRDKEVADMVSEAGEYMD